MFDEKRTTLLETILLRTCCGTLVSADTKVEKEKEPKRKGIPTPLLIPRLLNFYKSYWSRKSSSFYMQLTCGSAWRGSPKTSLRTQATGADWGPSWGPGLKWHLVACRGRTPAPGYV